MRPLRAAAGGLVLIVIDFRTEAFDLVPDVAGYALLSYAVAALTGWRAAVVPAAASVLSLGELVLPYHLVRYDRITGEMVPSNDSSGPGELIAFDPLTGWRLAMVAGAVALAGVTVLLLTETLHRRAAQRGALSSARQLRLAGAVVVIGWVAPYLAAAGAAAVRGDGLEPVWDDPASRVALLSVLVVMALAILLLRDAREPWALRPGSERTLPSMQRTSPG